MLDIIATGQFRKDFKKAKKRSKDLKKIWTIIDLLCEGKPLPERNKDHKLIGNYKNRRECHIEPDWLLIYQLSGKELILERTGTHSELFD